MFNVKHCSHHFLLGLPYSGMFRITSSLVDTELFLFSTGIFRFFSGRGKHCHQLPFSLEESHSAFR